MSLPYPKATASSVTYKIPCPWFEVAWLSSPFEFCIPGHTTAGSLILFCNHFLHRLVLRCLQASCFFFFEPQILRWLSSSCSFASLAGSGASRNQSANNNIVRQRPSLHHAHHQTSPPLSPVFVQLFITLIHPSILVIAARLARNHFPCFCIVEVIVAIVPH